MMIDDTATGVGPQGAAPQDDGWQWAIVEIFGHRQHAGRTREEERFGSKMLRIDIPIKGDAAANGWETVYYGGSSIFSFVLCTEERAVKANRPYQRPAVLALPYDEDDESNEEPF